MRQVLLWLFGGTAALMFADLGTLMVMDMARARGLDSPTQVDRSHKGDRPTTRSGALAARRVVATVEVVGIEQAAIVYRDRDGRILFRTDPMRNSTVVVRDVALPQVTVRENAQTPTAPSVVPPPQPSAPDPEATGKKLPDGCEPAASPLSASGTSHVRARCLAMGMGAMRFASVR